jgi:hypothetical protein
MEQNGIVGVLERPFIPVIIRLHCTLRIAHSHIGGAGDRGVARCACATAGPGSLGASPGGWLSSLAAAPGAPRPGSDAVSVSVS